MTVILHYFNIQLSFLAAYLTTHLVNGCSLAKHGSKRIEVANGGFIQMNAKITKIITDLHVII